MTRISQRWPGCWIAYKALHIVESGFAIRYKLLHSGKRQIVNVILPGDTIGFPACFYEYAVFSVTSIGKMDLHQVQLDAFPDLCLKRANIATALLGSQRGRRQYTPNMLSIPDVGSHSGDLPTFSWRC